MVTIVMSFIYMYYQPSINQKSVETDNDGKYVGVEGYDGDYGVYVENSSLPVPALSSSLSFYVYYGKHGNPKQVKFSIQLLEYVIPTAAPAPAPPSPKSPRYGVSPCYGVSLC